MSYQFKKGDPAITLKPVEDGDIPIPSGSLVELLFAVPAGHIFRSVGLLASESGWLVRSSDGQPAYYANRHLMPLRGDFCPEQTESLEVPA